MAKGKQAPSGKYHVDLSSEFEPGSRKRVLKNLLHITSVRMMEDAELSAYMRAERLLIQRYSQDHSFTSEDLNAVHRTFLGKIYNWAGSYRTVNLTKGGFPFASALAVPSAMKRFESTTLRPNTPCRNPVVEEAARMIAEVHVELLLIHPYREGNGRTARLLATLMAYQAGMPGIDFGFVGRKGRAFDQYVEAIQRGLDHNYLPMQEIVERALLRAGRLARLS